MSEAVDMWVSTCGRASLYCCDCLAVLPTLAAGSVDAVVTDPPFGIDYATGHGSESAWGNGAISGDHDTTARDAMLAHFGESVPILCFGSWRAVRPRGTRMLLIWDTLGALGMGDLALPWKPAHQEIYVLGNRLGFCGERGSDVLQCAPVQSMAKNGRLHPMQKPVELMERLIACVHGVTVCDPFMGSGSTGVAAIKMGRKFIGCERDIDYFAIAKRRIQQAIEDYALFQQPPEPANQAEMFDH